MFYLTTFASFGLFNYYNYNNFRNKNVENTYDYGFYYKENDDLKNYRHEIVNWFTKEIELIDGKDTKWNAIHFHNCIMMFENSISGRGDAHLESV